MGTKQRFAKSSEGMKMPRPIRVPWSMWKLDRELAKHQRRTRRELLRHLGPAAREGDAIAPTMHRVPPDNRAAVMDLLRRVDLGPGGPDVQFEDRLYDLLDDMAERKTDE